MVGTKVCVCVTDSALSQAHQDGQLQVAEMGWRWVCRGKMNQRRDSQGAVDQALMPH